MNAANQIALVLLGVLACACSFGTALRVAAELGRAKPPVAPADLEAVGRIIVVACLLSAIIVVSLALAYNAFFLA